MKLLGKQVADQLKQELKEKAAVWRKKGVTPKLVVVRVGNQQSDMAYENRMKQNCASVGITMNVKEVSRDIPKEAFLSLLRELDGDPMVHGILVFRPLPRHLEADEIYRAVSPEKDVDCMNPENLSRLFLGDPKAIPPCTAEAALAILNHYKMPLKGKHMVVINRSMVIGKPLAMLALASDATVTVCHSKTEHLSRLTQNADYVVTGAGKARLFGMEFFTPSSVVIDCGINFDEEGKLCGDIGEGVEALVSAVTPVPGGVGAVTSALLLCHVMDGLALQHSLD